MWNVACAFPQASDVCGSLEIECALEAVHDMSRQIDAFKEDAANGRLVLGAGETVSSQQDVLRVLCLVLIFFLFTTPSLSAAAVQCIRVGSSCKGSGFCNGPATGRC